MSAASFLRQLERHLNGQTRGTRPLPAHVSAPDTSLPTHSLTLSTTPLNPAKAISRIQTLLDGLQQAFAPVQNHLLGVWLHGSLGSEDTTPYSDVDALLLLRKEVLEDGHLYRQVQTAVHHALRHVLLFDPLQHHGFFVGDESHLAQWPADYLPLAALAYARPLWSTNSVTLHDVPAATPPHFLLHTLAQSLQSAALPRNLYQAKGLLSQLMLLPSAYCQAMGTAVYKRDSFGLVADRFAPWWQPLHEATLMRSAWQIPQRPLWPTLLTLTNPWWASRLYRPWERRLPACHFYPNWEAFLPAMKELAQVMIKTHSENA